MRRFFSSQPIAGPEVILTGPEVHHLLHVDRIQVGEKLILFDGSSCEYLARLVETSRDSVRLELLERLERDRMPAVELTLFAAVPKGRRMDVLVQMSCELGVASLVPLLTARSVVHPGPNKLDHWRRIVLESCKQSGRNLLMTVESPLRLADALAQPRPDSLALLLSTAPDARPLADVLGSRPSKVVLLVGPEGGFTDSEVNEMVRAEFVPVSLGPATLRVETAAVAAAAIVLAALR